MAGGLRGGCARSFNGSGQDGTPVWRPGPVSPDGGPGRPVFFFGTARLDPLGNYASPPRRPMSIKIKRTL
jgi:hypothetical protein